MNCQKHNEEKVKQGNKFKCKSCNKEYQQKWYQENKKLQSQKVSINRNKNKKLNRDYIFEFLKNNPCKMCGESDILVLEFDHLHNKKYNISEMLANGNCLEAVKKEIEKCQVLCANCHRRKTAIEQKTYRFTKQNE
jgi:5-methylcytosine-specific restriction endonuclease McrA